MGTPKSHWVRQRNIMRQGVECSGTCSGKPAWLGCDAGYYTHIFSARRLGDAHAFLSDLAGRRLSSFDANSRQVGKSFCARTGFRLSVRN